MLDTQSIQKLVEDQIKTLAQTAVTEILADGRWIQDIESKIIQHVQDRITARFSNIDTVPDLVDTVKKSVVNLVDQGRIPGISEFVDPGKVQQAIDSGVQSLVIDTIDNLVVDPSWLGKIETLVNQSMVSRVSQKLNEFDFPSLVIKQVDGSIDRWYDRLAKNFKTTGIVDKSSQLQLTVMDGVVVAEGEIAANDITVIKDARVNGTLVVKNLAVSGAINTDNRNWDELKEVIANKTLSKLNEDFSDNIASIVFDRARTSGIDFKSVTIDGVSLVDGNKLNPKINTLGPLSSLTVTGDANIYDTLNISNRRVGINTQYPDMALGVWDEEVAVGIGKFGAKQAYIGTTRDQSLVIGTNKNSQVTIDTDGTVTVKNLKVGQFRIGHASEVPGYAGNRGDMVFNCDPKPNQPFAWVCLGSYKWQPIKSA